MHLENFKLKGDQKLKVFIFYKDLDKSKLIEDIFWD